MQFKIFGSMVLAAAAMSLAASAAQASFVAQFEANGGPITSFTGSGGVINQSNVAVGTFDITIYDATSNSGSSNTPQISAISVGVKNTDTTVGPDILAINLWDTGFSPPPGSTLTLAGSGSVTFNAAISGDSVTYASGADPLDGTYSLTTPPPVQTPLYTATYSSGGFPQTQTLVQQTKVFIPNGTNPFSMGNNLELSLAGGSNVTLSYTTTVPEPASLGLLAVGGLGLLVRRRKRVES